LIRVGILIGLAIWVLGDELETRRRNRCIRRAMKEREGGEPWPR